MVRFPLSTPGWYTMPAEQIHTSNTHPLARLQTDNAQCSPTLHTALTVSVSV